VGIGLGAELTLVDTYLTELMPAARRGRLLASSYALGMLAVPITGILASLLPHHLAGLPNWRWLLIGSSTGALIMWLLRGGLPESPRWLAPHHRAGEALSVLAKIESDVARTTRRRATARGPAPRRTVPGAAPDPDMLRLALWHSLNQGASAPQLAADALAALAWLPSCVPARERAVRRFRAR
jgi:MFS transporter, putative metabolite:H+ symporter